MAIAGGRWVRLGVAALFVAATAGAIVSTAAGALDVQGNDALARAISTRTTQQQWRHLSQEMANGKRPLDAATLAKVRAEAIRQPLSAIPLFLAGATRNLEGDVAGARRLADLAVRRDPRFLPARYWQTRFAAERNDVAAATDAALRTIVLDPGAMLKTIPVLVELTRSRESWPKIRAALPTAESWREIYFDRLVEAGFEPSVVFNAIDVARAASGKPPTVREQVNLLRSMTQKGDFDRAYTAWLGWLPPDALGKVAYLYDGGFTGAPGAAPFNWSLGNGSDGAAVIDKEHGLRFDYSPNGSMQLANETMLIPPGRYRLVSFSQLDQEIGQDIPLPVAWQVACLPKRNVVATLRLPNSAAPKGVATFFEVPADCPAQTLSLEGIAMEYPVRAGGYVRSVAIEKAK